MCVYTCTHITTPFESQVRALTYTYNHHIPKCIVDFTFMASLIESLDTVGVAYCTSLEPKQYTEKGNKAYGWMPDHIHDYTSNSDEDENLKERIVQFYFQTTLENKDVSPRWMQHKYMNLLYDTHDTCYFDIVIKLAMQTRDIEDGKGMYSFSYYMLECLTWICYEMRWISRDFFHGMLRTWVQEFELMNKMQMPYGSWKDMKHFLTHLHGSREMFLDMRVKGSIIHDIVRCVYVPQMVKDMKNMSIALPVSLLGKWLPRESSKSHKWLVRIIAQEFYFYVFQMRPTRISIVLKYYRHHLSKLNQYLDTTQVHMCNREWDRIDFERVTALTLHKSKDAFLNHKHIDEEHRHICKQNFEEFICEKLKNNECVKGKVMMPHQFVKEALYQKQYQVMHDEEYNEMQAHLLNMQWNGLVKHVKETQSPNSFMGRSISCIDTSPSMYSSPAGSLPLCSAIGMGMMTMECSSFKRCFTFSSEPQWINVETCDTFIQQAHLLRGISWGPTTNISAMFDMILEHCLKHNVSNEELSSYNLIIFSDMQFDECVTKHEHDLMDHVRCKFATYNYTCIPYIVFWNLRTTETFPCVNKSQYCTRLSGCSASLFRFFMMASVEEVRNMDNWTLLCQILSNPRYDIHFD
jgi:hypothetical protein